MDITLPNFDFALAVNLITPVLIGIVGNLIIFLYFTKKFTETIEEYKITFSGVFQKRVQVYEDLLEKLFLFEYSLYHLEQTFSSENALKTGKMMEELTILLNKSRPFLASEISDPPLRYLKQTSSLFRKMYESGTQHSQSQKDEFFRNLNTEEIRNLKEQILGEMRKDLKTNKLYKGG